MDRAAVIVDFVGRDEVQENLAREEVGRELAAYGNDTGSSRPGDDIADGAAYFVDLRIIGDCADLEVRGRFNQELTADRPAIAIVDVFAQIDDLTKTIAAVVAAVDRERDILGDRAGDVGLQNVCIEIAVGRLDSTAEGELRLTGDNRDDPSRCVLTEQGRLRAVQNFDALNIGKVGQGAGRT